MNTRYRMARCLLAAICACSLSRGLSAATGEEVYARHCARCHEQATDRVPPRAALAEVSARRILRSLDFGTMIGVSYSLTRADREAVAAYLSQTPDRPYAPPATAYCADRKVTLALNHAVQWNGWSPAADNARFQPAAAAGLAAADVPRLKLKWAFVYQDDVIAFAQPAVIGNHLFVGSASGRVHALDARTGCIHWMFEADGPVRAAPVIAALPDGSGAVLLFPDQIGGFYAVRAETGELLWKRRIEDHEATRLTGAAAVHDGVVYVPVASWEETRAGNPDYACCTFRGSIVALAIADGREIWKRWMIETAPERLGIDAHGQEHWAPSGAGIWAAPAVDARRERLYVATGDNYSTPATGDSDAIRALDLATGRILWTTQTTRNDVFNAACIARNDCPGPDYDYGAAVVIAHTISGRELLLAGQKSGIVYALDPDADGAILWQARVGSGGTTGGVQWGLASDGDTVYAASSDVTRTLTANTQAGGADATNPYPPPPDPRQGGGVTALRVADGTQRWFAPPGACGDRPGCAPGHSAALTAIPGAVFAGALDGHLRAYAAEDGRVLWDFDTVGEYPGSNGIAGHGGSIDGPGVVVAGGIVYVNSGYARTGGIAGNVLLAFGVESD